MVGPRQVGKTCLLVHLFQIWESLRLLDYLRVPERTRQDPVLLLADQLSSIISDQFRYAPFKAAVVTS